MDPVKINLKKHRHLFTDSPGGYITPGRILRANKKWRKKPKLATNAWTHFPRAVCEQVVTHYMPELMSGRDDCRLRFFPSKRNKGLVQPLGKVANGYSVHKSEPYSYREENALIDSFILPQPLVQPWRNPANAEKVCDLLCVAARLLFPRKIRVRALRVMCTPFLPTEHLSPGFLRLSKLSTLAGKCYKVGSPEFNMLLAIWATHVPRYTQMLFSGGEYQAFGLRYPSRKTEHFKGSKTFYSKDGYLQRNPPIFYTWDVESYNLYVMLNEKTLVETVGLT